LKFCKHEIYYADHCSECEEEKDDEIIFLRGEVQRLQNLLDQEREDKWKELLVRIDRLERRTLKPGEVKAHWVMGDSGIEELVEAKR